MSPHLSSQQVTLPFKKTSPGNSLVFQWLGLSAFTKSVQIQSLVGKLSSHKLYGMAKNTKKETFLYLFPSTVLFQEPFTVVSITWSLGNWRGEGNSGVRLLSHSLATLCLLPDFCFCIVSKSPSHSLSWPLHGWVQWYTLHHLIHPRTLLVLTDSTVIACYLQGISSRTPGIPKSMGAQVSYIICCSAAGPPSPWVPQLWIQRADWIILSFILT